MWESSHMNDLVITLDTKKDIPLYEQIYRYIKEDIQKGNLLCGQRLPSSRKLSVYLEISRSTVELAYEQLVSEGYLETIPCKGYYVAQIDELYRLNNMTTEGMGSLKDKSDVALEEQMEYLYEFSPNGIELRSFPYNAWRKISKNVLAEEKEIFTLGNSKGEKEFRDTIRYYLYQARGMVCDSEQIVIGAGNEYLLMLLSTIIGLKKIAFENPTYERAYRMFENLSHDVCCVNMDQHGMRIDELEDVGAELAYVMPSHQFPTGVVMPIKRRLELLKWAMQNEDRYIIEDDYDSEFRYKGKPIPALQGYDTGDKVIYLGTFSKSIAPAIRMSYMVLPKKLMKEYHRKCKHLSTTVSKIDQMIVNEFICEGYYERHLNKARAMYKARHDVLLQMLKPLVVSGRCKVRGEHAGVHLLLEFQDESEEADLIERAQKVKVRVFGMSKYYIEKGDLAKATILLGYANMSEDEIEEAVEILLLAWKNV